MPELRPYFQVFAIDRAANVAYVPNSRS